MERIEETQKQYLLSILDNRNINENIIKVICDVNRIEDLDKRKFNYLMLLLSRLEELK